MDNRRNDGRNMDRRYNRPPRIHGKDVEALDLTKVKRINAEALARSVFNNMIVDKLEFSNPSGNYCTVSGNQLLLYTLTPSKPLIDCPYISLKVTHEITMDKHGDYITRLCTFNKKPGETDMCYLTIDKIASGLCVGKKTYLSSHEFWIVTGGHIQIDEEDREFKIGFFNKNANSFLKEEFRENPDNDKAKVLWNLYNAMKTGIIKSPTIPKPGNNLFHTLFSGIVDIDIETITGEKIKGVIKGYELTPGGSPSLNVWISQEKLRVVPLYTIAVMIINKYDIPDMLSRRTVELITNGHVVVPHRANNTIYDYCKSYKRFKDQEIKLDGNISPYEQLDKHDMELTKIIRSIN